MLFFLRDRWKRKITFIFEIAAEAATLAAPLEWRWYLYLELCHLIFRKRKREGRSSTSVLPGSYLEQACGCANNTVKYRALNGERMGARWAKNRLVAAQRKQDCFLINKFRKNLPPQILKEFWWHQDRTNVNFWNKLLWFWVSFPCWDDNPAGPEM